MSGLYSKEAFYKLSSYKGALDRNKWAVMSSGCVGKIKTQKKRVNPPPKKKTFSIIKWVAGCNLKTLYRFGTDWKELRVDQLKKALF